MSSADKPRKPRPMWLKIATGYWLAFGALFAITAFGILFSVIYHHVTEYHEHLSLLSKDLAAEYAEYGSDLERMSRDFRETAEEKGRANVFIIVTDQAGNTILEESSNRRISSLMREKALEDASTFRVISPKNRRGDTIAVRIRKTRLNDGNVLLVGDNVSSDELHSRQIAIILALSGLLMLFAGGIVGAALARRFTAPLRRIAKAAKRIGQGDYSIRLAASRDIYEIAELENAFTKMCAELEKTLGELRVLTDSMAHDLRTPVTHLRSAAELRAMDGAEPDELAQTVLEETDAMLSMVNTMLEISQTQCGISRSSDVDLDLAAFVRNMVELYSTLAEDKSISLDCSVPQDKLIFRGQKPKLQQLTGNLLDNAVKFTPPGGSISVRLTDHPIALEVENSGPGIAPKDIPHVFKRFWRADSSRSQRGNGLGLALVDAIATYYGAKATCTSTPGKTTTFRIQFP